MSAFIILTLLIVHWFADFCLQTQEQGMNKSKSIKYLLMHTTVYSLVWLVPIFIITLDIGRTVGFVIITFICHTLTDYVTSKISKHYYERNKYYGILGFWSIIGFDQVLHYAQLFLTYKFLIHE